MTPSDLSNTYESIPSKIERFADAMTHGIGLFLSILGLFLLIFKAAISENMWIFLGFSVYGVSLVSTYLASTIYHLYAYYHPIPNKKFRRYLLLFDHCSIFFLIAGSYSPIILFFMRTSLGWSILGLIWLLTFAGIVYKIYYIGKFKRFSLFMYISMGWLIVLSIKDMLILLPMDFIKFIFVGGMFYMVGIIFYQKKNISFNHAIWHLFVLIGSCIHYYAMITFIR